MSRDGAGDLWRRVSRASAGDDYAHAYATRFDELAAEGRDVHGEAAFVHSLVRPGARLLDAGCGTGRIGQRLDALGHTVVGADVDETMVAVARERAPHLTWLVSDLAEIHVEGSFDAVVLAGNVVPFVAPEALPAVASRLASLLVPGGLLVTGFGLDPDHLPDGAGLVPWTTYAEACGTAGLDLVARHGGWSGEPADEGYAVTVHRRGTAL